MNWNHSVRDFFEAQNWRVTLAVRQILEILEGAHHFLSAYEIAKLLDTRADVSTIYRILEKLQQGHFVHEFQGKWKRCDHLDSSDEAHHFLICDECGKAEEIVLNYKTAISDQLAREKNFLLKKVHLGFLGTCKDCH